MGWDGYMGCDNILHYVIIITCIVMYLVTLKIKIKIRNSEYNITYIWRSVIKI